VLYNERKRLQELALRESQGETFWTSRFDNKVRRKLLTLLAETGDRDAAMEQARHLILKDEGLPFLFNDNPVPEYDFEMYVMGCPDEMMPTVIEAMFHSLGMLSRSMESSVFPVNVTKFRRDVNVILQTHRVSFKFLDREMVALESMELHKGVLEPTVSLLRDPRFPKVERAYRDALDELTKGKPGDAITDAATALQELLVALGCKGDSLGPLLKSARNKGLLAAHDPTLTEGLVRTIDWVSADRSNMGDAHKADSAAIDDAWFTVHVVGALIVRLAGPGRTIE
jgi:hypothetical protein